MRSLPIFIFVIWASSLCAQIKAPSRLEESINQHRLQYYQGLIKSDQGPLDSADFKNLDFFPVNDHFECICLVKLTPESKPIELTTYSGKKKPYRKFAELSCPTNEGKINISAFESLLYRNHPIYQNQLFVPFKDETNGESTYGGGRYLDIHKSTIENGQVVVDFNKAYNPWCAYSEGFNCPIPPPENQLSIEIKAGEKKYRGTIKVK